MKSNLFSVLTLLCLSCGHAVAREFDPLLDPEVRVVARPGGEVWDNEYMWYPGQLAAFRQENCARISKERCVNVGYPGKFFAKSNKAYFKKTMRSGKALGVKWAGPESVVLYVNGVRQPSEESMARIPAGKSEIMFEVTTVGDRLPCILLDGEGFRDNSGWLASMDGEYWTLPESAPCYNDPEVAPDAAREITAIIRPRDIFPLRNSEAMGPDGLRIGRNGYALVDFFHLELGALVFRAKGNGSITIRVGETPEEALERDESKFEQYPMAPVVLSVADTTVRMPVRALRYASIECDSCVEISDIRFEAEVWPVEYGMRFESDSEYVNDLFGMSAATLHASMHDFYLDGIKRDFLPWSMDALVSTFGGDYLFGDQQVSRNGISIALMPLGPDMSDIGIPDYPLHALIGLKQNYLRYGDLETSLQYRDRIVQLLDFYASIVDEDGFVHGNYGDPQFGYTPGWSTYNGPARKGIASYAQIMLYLNYEIGAYFSELWKDKGLSRKYGTLAAALKEKIFERFWDEEKKAFINGTMNDGVTVDGRISHHAQYWAVLAGLFPEKYYDHLFTKTLPSLPNYYSSISYEKGYEFLAYAKAGRVRELWDYVYRVFGDWMDQGHTRFPENFMPEASRAKQLEFYRRPYGLSLCHGANGVPVIVGIINGLAGFSQSDTRPSEYMVRPELLDLGWFELRIPIKEGYIDMHCSAEGASSIEIPAGCSVKVITGKDEKPVLLRSAGRYEFNL